MKDFFRQVKKTVLADGWGSLNEYAFDLKRRDGTWQQLTREVYERGAAVTCLLHNPETDNIILIRQFRLASHVAGRDGFMIEAPAGTLDGIDPTERMIAELEEETGFRISYLQKIYDLIMSPGGADQTVTYFVGTYDPRDRVSDGGGLKDEGEDIEVLEIPLDKALAMVKSGEIFDAKTVILLQYMALQR